jgi:hypothetical protein
MELERNMKKHIFETTKISNLRNKKKIDKNKNITLRNHIRIIPLYNSFKPQPLGTSRCLLGLKGIIQNIKSKTYDNVGNTRNIVLWIKGFENLLQNMIET